MNEKKLTRLAEKINSLKKTKIKKSIDSRLKEFREIGKNSKEIFSELCFCILTANFNAERGIKIQKELCSEFHCAKEKLLAKKLRESGHRFPNMRAKFICEAQKHSNSLKQKINSFENENELREWLVKNFKGLGFKEASHFMRNTGFENIAIIDFHIIDLLVSYGIIKKPKTNSLNKKIYLEIEEKLEKLAEKTKTSLAELDLYLWFMETGKILK